MPFVEFYGSITPKGARCRWTPMFRAALLGSRDFFPPHCCLLSPTCCSSVQPSSWPPSIERPPRLAASGANDEITVS